MKRNEIGMRLCFVIVGGSSIFLASFFREFFVYLLVNLIMAEEKSPIDTKCIHPAEDELIDEFIRMCFGTTKKKVTWKQSASKNGVVLDVTTDPCFDSFFKDKEDATSGLQIVRGVTEVANITPRVFYEWNEGFQPSHVE